MTPEMKKLAEAWAYINKGIEEGLWNHEDFAGCDDEDIIELVERLQVYEKQWRL